MSYEQMPDHRKEKLVLGRDNYTCQFCLSERATKVTSKRQLVAKTRESCQPYPAWEMVSVCDSCLEPFGFAGSGHYGEKDDEDDFDDEADED